MIPKTFGDFKHMTKEDYKIACSSFNTRYTQEKINYDMN